MAKSSDLKKFAILVNILAELRAISDERAEKKDESEVHEVMLYSVEEEFREEMGKMISLLKDKKLRKAFVEMVLSEFLNRVRLFTGRVSCVNCEKFADCRLERMIREKRFLPGWHGELEKDAVLCERYTPQEELISGREFRNKARHVFEIFRELGIEVSRKTMERINEAVESSVLSFIEKTKEKNKVVVN